MEIVGQRKIAKRPAQIEALQPGVAVLDCRLSRLAGTEITQGIQRQGLPSWVLALSAYSDERYVRGMLEAGAAGYLLKEEAPEVIAAAVRAATRFEGALTETPAWSPDGAWLAFSTDAGGVADVWLVEIAGGAVQQVTRNANARCPVWLAGGK